MSGSPENPLLGGAEGVSLPGWVLSFGTIHPDTPPMEGNPIFMLNGAAQAAWGTPVKTMAIRYSKGLDRSLTVAARYWIFMGTPFEILRSPLSLINYCVGSLTLWQLSLLMRYDFE